MRKIIVLLMLLMFSPNLLIAFEVDGIVSGISKDEAQKILEKRNNYPVISAKENHIIASDDRGESHRFLSISFCKDKLYQIQKNTTPSFKSFTRLIEQKRRELGKPLDAWSDPEDVMSSYERDRLSFLWKDGETFVTVSYTKFSQNSQLDVTYEIASDCASTP